MKQLCYMGILKEGFSAYSSPVMLISRKLTKDKRVVIDIRHLNVRIAKNNLAYPLVRDTFPVLESLKCDILLVLDLKNAFHSLQLSENSKDIVEYFCISAACPIYIKGCPWDWIFPIPFGNLTLTPF